MDEGSSSGGALAFAWAVRRGFWTRWSTMNRVGKRIPDHLGQDKFAASTRRPRPPRPGHACRTPCNGERTIEPGVRRHHQSVNPSTSITMNSRVIAKKPAVMWAMNAYSILDRLSQEEEAEEEDANSKKQPSTWSTDDDFKAVDGMEKEKEDAYERELNDDEPWSPQDERKRDRESVCFRKEANVLSVQK